MDNRIENIMNANILLTDGMNDAIDATKTTMQLGTSSIITGGIAESAKDGAIAAVNAAGGGSKSIAFFSYAPIAFMAVGATLVLGGAGYLTFSVIRDKKYIAKRRDEYLRNESESIWILYFKDEIIKARNYAENALMNRDHEAISTYIKYLEESVLDPEQMNDPEYLKKIAKYKKRIEEYIKPEHIKDFHDGIRYYCAYHQIGEFTPKDTSWHSANWYEREELKGKMYKCMRDISSSSDSFVEIRNLVYRFHSIVEGIGKEEKPEKFVEYCKQVERLMEKRIEPSKRKEFDLLFRRYRYLGNKCEFDREKVLDAPFFFNLYGGKLSSLNTVSVCGDHRNYDSPSELVLNDENAGFVFVFTTMLSGAYAGAALFCAQTTGALELACAEGCNIKIHRW